MIHLDTVDKLRQQVASARSRALKSSLGQFMTPSATAQFMASLFTAATHGPCHLIDPGAGIGSLSSAFLDRCVAGELAFESIHITAYEYDASLHSHLRQVLTAYGEKLGAETEVVGGDFIEHAVNARQFNGGSRFTHAIMNPPYKKINTGSRHRLLAREIGLETVNLYTAFLGCVIALMQDGGEIVAIIPRSFCNGPYYRPFRQFMLHRTALCHIHLFKARDKAFKEDNVLQETIIVRLRKGETQGPVKISASENDTSADLETYVHPFDKVVFPDDDQLFIHIPLAEAESSLIGAADAFSFSLEDLGIGVCTGPVVDFRLKEHLRMQPESGCVPLLYANHLSTGELVWPAESKKPNGIVVNNETRKWLMPNGTYTTTRRFSSKEERRRVVASVVPQAAFPTYALLGFENHLNVFHRRKGGLPLALAHGLAIYLNSTAVDQHLRRFSGHTQVNATDLRKLPYPSEKALLALGEWAMRQGAITQNGIDAKIAELTRET